MSILLYVIVAVDVFLMPVLSHYILTKMLGQLLKAYSCSLCCFISTIFAHVPTCFHLFSTLINTFMWAFICGDLHSWISCFCFNTLKPEL